MPVEAPVRITSKQEGKVIPVADLFKGNKEKAGRLFDAIGIDHNGKGDSAQIGRAKIQVHSEKYGIATVRDEETGVNESITYGAIHRKDGDNGTEVTFVLPPRVSEDGTVKVFDVVDLTPHGATKRSATPAERVIAKDQEPQRLFEPEQARRLGHPVNWLEKLNAPK